MIFWIRNAPARGDQNKHPYGVTYYGAKLDADSTEEITFSLLDVIHRRDELVTAHGEEYAKLFDYIKSTLLDWS